MFDTPLILIINPFTAPACKISRLKDAWTCLKNRTFSWSYHTSTFNAMRFDDNPFTHQYKKEKGLRVSNFALLTVIFKWHHVSEWVNTCVYCGVWKRSYRINTVLWCVHLPASPPKFISFEQLMDAANGVKNMSLAHEIVVNNDFQIEKLQPEQNRWVCA